MPPLTVEVLTSDLSTPFGEVEIGVPMVNMLDETAHCFHHRLEKYKLAEQILVTVDELLTQRGLLFRAGTAVDATQTAASTSTKNNSKARDPEMHSSKKGNQWYFGMKAHIGADAESSLVHTVHSTSSHVSDIAEGNTLLHGQETVAFSDTGYEGIEKRADAKTGVAWHVVMRPGKRKALNKENEADAMIDQVEKLKVGIRAKVEHPFGVLKRRFGFVKVRYPGLKKNTEQLFTLFALSRLWIVHSKLMEVGALSAPANRAGALQEAKEAQVARKNGEMSGDRL